MQTRKVMYKLDLIECTLMVFKTDFFSANNFNNFEYLERTGELITLLNLMLEILLLRSFCQSPSIGIISNTHALFKSAYTISNLQLK